MKREDLENCLGESLATEVADALHSGGLPVEFRLMSNAEAAVAFRVARKRDAVPPEARLLWTDDEGSFLGVYNGGPLNGMIFAFDEEGGLDLSPLYRNVRSLVAHLSHGPSAAWENGWRYSADFPNQGYEVVGDASDAEYEGDYLAVEKLRGSDSFEGAALFELGLIPPSFSHEIIAYLEKPDDRVRSKAARLVGFRKVSSAVPRLHSLATIPDPAINVSAMIGLGLMKTDESLVAMLEAASQNSISRNALPSALKLWGAEVRRAQNWQYRLPNTELWNLIPGS